jgi:hypothetical protein
MEGGGGNFEVLAPGLYPARLVSVVDCGMQNQRPYQGQEKPPAEELALTYELLDAFMLDEDGQVDKSKPRWITEFVKHYSREAERSTIAKRMNAMDPDNVWGEDWTKFIGHPINLVITITEKKGRKYENVDGMAPMRPQELENAPELVNPPRLFDFDDPDMEVFENLPRFIQKKIKEAINYSTSAVAKALNEGGPASEAPAGEEAEQENPY